MDEIPYKEALTVISIVLIFVGYIPYIRDIFRWKTHPHIFSWIVWSILNFCLFWLQIEAWAGLASWIVLFLWVNSTYIAFLSYKYWKRDIRKIDIIFFSAALFAIPLWLLLDQALFSAVLVTWIGVFAFVPTIRKTWANPYSETVSTYCITTFRHILTLFALSEYNLITVIFPGIWVWINLSFLIMIFYRRVTLKKHNASL